MNRLTLVAPLLLFPACRGPASIESTVEFQTERGIVRGVSTEDGIFAPVETVPPTGELNFRYRAGNGFFDDIAQLQWKNETLAVLTPKSSRLNLARFAAYPAAHDEPLFIEARTANRGDLLACHLFDGGRLGDLLVLDEARADFEEIVRHYAGAGVFAWRVGTMQLVGILNGVYCDDPRTIAFIGLDEIATLLPASSDYFARKVLPRRADFEFGVPRSFEGERPAASDPAPAGEPAPEVAKPADVNPPKNAIRKDH